MGRPRTATNILEARGAFKNHSERKRPNEPIPASAFPKRPPRHLTENERKCWREIVKLVPAGVLTSADTIAVEILSTLLVEFRAERAAMSTQKLLRMTALMSKLGLDPSGRASLSVDKPEANPFDEV